MIKHGSGRLGSPLKWYGSKVRLSKWLRQYMPQHRRYVDVFGGGGAVLFAKLRAADETLNDIDDGLTTFYEVLRDDGAELQSRLLALDTVEEIGAYFNSEPSASADAMTRAIHFFINCRASFSGEMRGRRCFAIRDAGNRPKEEKYAVYRNAIHKLPRYAERLAGVAIENESFETLIPRFDKPSDLLYLDPPYLGSLRTTRGQKCYVYDMTEAEPHIRLLEMASKSRAMVMLSGYEWNFVSGKKDSLYSDTLRGWFKTILPIRAAAGRWNRNGKTTEYREENLWLNPLARSTLAEHGSDVLRERLLLAV